MKLGIIGGGAWGTALAQVAASGLGGEGRAEEAFVAKLETGRELTRRGFLRRAGATSLGGLAFPTIVSATVRGGAGGVAPGDKIDCFTMVTK